MKKEMETAQAAVLPASTLGKGVSYTLSLWEKFTRFLEHPELELSNNWAENSMRPVVLGRKNWIHVGSEQAGPKAAILSVVETCRRLKMPVREYLAFVFTRSWERAASTRQSTLVWCLGIYPQLTMKKVI
jgi:transposase